MTETLLYWGFALLGVAFALAIVELFVPSGGLIAVTAGLVAVAGIVAFWKVDWIWGVTSLTGTIIFGIALFQFAMKVMPYTAVGRGLILGDQDGEEAARRAQEERARYEAEQALIGATGVAMTSCRPVGSAEIEGTRIEVLAVGGSIEAGTPVKVVSVEGNQVKVRAITA
jgi:membrane-bound ClpP family serine protease